MNIMHHDYLKIFINDDLYYEGEIVIYEDNSCEGLLINKNNDQYYTHGTFEKNKCFNLIIENNESRIIFNGKKTYLQYEGNYKVMNNNNITEMPFYLKVTSLDVDPRDYYLEDDPKNIFLSKLNRFKEDSIHSKTRMS